MASPSGPRSACGSNAITPAMASAFARWVVLVIHHNSTNCVNALPISESACPVQIVKNRNFQSLFSGIPSQTAFSESRETSLETVFLPSVAVRLDEPWNEVQGVKYQIQIGKPPRHVEIAANCPERDSVQPCGHSQGH